MPSRRNNDRWDVREKEERQATDDTTGTIGTYLLMRPRQMAETAGDHSLLRCRGRSLLQGDYVPASALASSTPWSVGGNGSMPASRHPKRCWRRLGHLGSRTRPGQPDARTLYQWGLHEPVPA